MNFNDGFEVFFCSEESPLLYLKLKDRYEYQCRIKEQSRFCFCNSIVYRKIDTKKIQRKLFCEHYLFGRPAKANYYLLRTVFLEDNF